jgi:glycosyltransferase involved in cell wall biosynthesis
MSPPAEQGVPRARADEPRRAKVWLVADVYPPDCGGSGWSAHALATTLIARGHEVEIVCAEPSAVGTRQRVFETVRITEVGVARARRNPMRRLGANDYAHAMLESYLSERLAAEPDVRILHAQHLHSGPPTVAAAEAQGRAAVQTLRDYWPVCLHGTSWWGGNECPGCSTANLTACMRAYWNWPGLVGRIMVFWARRRLAARRAGIARAGKVITVSHWVRQRIETEIPGARYTVIPNLVDIDRAEAEAETGRVPELPFGGPYLVAAGKLLATKGFDGMLRDLAAAGNDLPVVIAGSGPALSGLQAQATALDFEVHFTGWTEHASLLALIRSARAFLLPGAWNEPLSRLLLEALALAAPVFVWPSGGNTEHLTNGSDAWVIDGSEALREALHQVDDDRRRDAVGAAGRALAQRLFSPQAVYPQVLAAYESALQTGAERTAR